MSPFTADGTENRMRWDRRARGFMEVWYATANHRPTGAGVWFRYTLTAPRAEDTPPYCELWGFYFDPEGKRHFGARTRYPIDRLGAPNGRDDGALVRIGDAWLAEGHLEGHLERDGRSLEWSLDFEPSGRTFQHLPARLRKRIERRVSTLCSPNLSVPFMGSVVVDGETLDFDHEPGGQSHRWGRQHSISWAWSHCSLFDGSEHAIFEGVAARASVGPIPAPTVAFLYLNYQGRDMSFNDLKWALRARTTYEMPTWSFTAHNDRYRIVGAARAPIDRFLQVEYTDPDGSNRYCANSEIADLGIEAYEKDRGRWRHMGSLTAFHTAHLEFGRREPFESIPIVA